MGNLIPRKPQSADSLGLSRVLRALFNDGDDAPFVVLRNGELLPDRLTGTDLDVTVTDAVSVEDVFRYVCEKASDVGWRCIAVSKRRRVIGFSLVPDDFREGIKALHVDVFDGISAFGIPIMSAGELGDESYVENGVRQLSGRCRVLATVLHHLAWTGGLLKQKYRREVRALLRDESECEWFRGRIEDSVGKQLAKEICDERDTEMLGEQCYRRRLRVLLSLAKRQVRLDPFVLVRGILTYFMSQIPSMVHPPGLVGTPGDSIRGVRGVKLSLALACEVSPWGFAVGNLRESHEQIKTLNGPIYEASVRNTWKRWRLVRWFFPFVFLWYLAKRNRWVVVEQAPFLMRLLRGASLAPGWIGRESSEPETTAHPLPTRAAMSTPNDGRDAS